jgi:hypothetical protein
MAEIRRIVGVQIHHSSHLRDAAVYLVNARTRLTGAKLRSGDPELEAIDGLITEALGRTAKLRDAAAQRLRSLWEEDPDLFVRCRDGAEPWPDETTGGFEPRCTCYDACRMHFDFDDNPRDEGGVMLAELEGWRCQCGPCPLHPDDIREDDQGSPPGPRGD